MSINSRLLVSAVAVLAAFLGLTGFALDKAFRESALDSVRDRLQIHIYLLLSAAELGATGHLELPEVLPEARFSSPASGLFAELVTGDGRLVWQSPSTLSRDIPYPETARAGESVFTEVVSKGGEPLFSLSFAVIWVDDNAVENHYVFRVSESTVGYEQQVRGFRHSLLIWFCAAAAVLLVLQTLILRWGLAPLRRVITELGEVESGHKDGLSEDYPREIRVLSANLNAFIRYRQSQLHRYRNALDDLAHSLKPPLAVLRSVNESDPRLLALRETLSDQVTRMQQVVDYQLQRAAAAGRSPLVTPVSVKRTATRLTESLAKVYADKCIQYSVAVDSNVRFYGDEGDLTEILGNLLDNASKWAHKQVRVSARHHSEDHSRRKSLSMTIEDDGPGISESDIERLLRRGGRTASSNAGQGIGLTVAREIVEDLYAGRLSLTKSAFGGVSVVLQFDVNPSLDR